MYKMDQKGKKKERITVGARYLSLFQIGAHPASYSLGTWGKPTGIKFNPSHISSTEVKNDWSYTSTPPICLCGLDRDTFYAVVHSVVSCLDNISTDRPDSFSVASNADFVIFNIVL